MRTLTKSILIILLIWCQSKHLNAEDRCASLTDPPETIEYLIGVVETSNLTFIRNGQEGDSKTAASHIRSKYDYFKADIRTPEEFIKKCAAKSIMSGKPYTVRLADGSVTNVSDWLTSALAEFRKKGCPKVGD